MAVNQAMVFGFLERIGASRGFGADRVNLVLIGVGVVNLFPAVLAAVLQKRLAAQHVALVAPALQAGLALVIASSQSFLPYALAASLYVAVMIFTHTFLFGWIARIDPSGRAVAATPAMMMLGSAIGPGIGGAIAQSSGYTDIGWAAVVVAGLAVGSMAAVIRSLARQPAQQAARATVASADRSSA
jgi:predicted MFS family arabinose efflux permease